MADRFAVGIGAGKTWTNADTSLWSATSGGASGASVPGAGDVAIFDANSGGTGAYRVSLNYDPTLSGITLAGISASVKLFLCSSAKGTARTITAGTVTSGTNCIFQDITGAGAGSWDLSGVISGNGGGCTGITFTTADENFWISGTGSMSDATHYSTTTGGANDGRIPLPQDTFTVDANSGTGTITQDLPYIPGANFTGSASITWTTSTAASFFSSINLTGLATLTASTQAYTYEGRGSSTLTSSGKTWAKIISVDAVSGTLTAGDALTITGTAVGLNLRTGTFDDGGFSITIDLMNAAIVNSTRVLNMSSTWTLTGDTNMWQVSTSATVTVNAGTSTIRITSALTTARSFVGGDKTYYRLENATTGAFALQFTGSNTFSNGIYVDCSAAARTIQFTAGTTTTLGGLGISRDAGSNMLTIASITAAAHTLSKATGRVSLHDTTVTNSTATQTNTFYAGATPPSVDGGGNTNWLFEAAPGGGAGNLLLLGVSGS